MAQDAALAGDHPQQLAQVHVQLIPYVRLDGGTRLFDHNRKPGDLDNYSFGSAEYFSVPNDSSCQPVAGIAPRTIPAAIVRATFRELR